MLLLPKGHVLLDLRDGLGRVQTLGTRSGAIQDRVTAVQTHAVLQHLLALRMALVAGIVQPAERLEQDGRAKVFFAVPPVRWTRRGAAGAQDAFVEAVELFALLR